MKYIKKIIKKIRKACIIIFNIISNRFFGLFPIKENRVLFLSDVRKEIGEGNLAYIYNYLPEKYEKITFFKADRSVRRSLIEKIKLMYNLSVSKYILLDDFSASTAYMKVRANQDLIQLWHGPGAYKKFGHSRAKEGGDLENRIVHPGYKRYTKVIASSEDIRPCYAEAFSVDIKKVKATGFPRTDLFFNKKEMNKKIERIRKKYPFFKDKKIILFAPTYRGVKVKDAYYDFDKINLDKIYNKFKNDYVFLFKWHPALEVNLKKGKVEGYDLSKYKDFYYDLSDERDINDLLLVADILITDYSSVIFDWAFLNKPIIYFAYDSEEYKNGRGLYFDFDEYIYGPVAETTDELIKAIKKEDLCLNKRKKFMKKHLGACDGNSTKKTYEWIFENK